MQLEPLTERQRIILLSAVKNAQIDINQLYLLDPHMKVGELAEEIHYLQTQLQHGRGL